MKKFIQTFISHGPALSQFKYAFIGLFGIFMVFGTTVNAWNNFNEIFSDRSDWYIYNSVNPIKPTFATGESLKFVSDVTYRKPIDMRWEDTLWCRQEDGVKKYRTQFWPENKESERRGVTQDGFEPNGDTPFWEYTEEPLSSKATSCKMCWKAIGETPHGHEKIWSDCTEWFGVNGNNI